MLQSIRCVSQCCYSTLVVHHPFYKNNIFLVFADVVKMGESIPTDMKPVMRIQMKDYPKSRVPELLPFTEGGKTEVKIDSLDDLSALDDYGKYGTKEGMYEAFTKGKAMPVDEVPTTKIGKTTQDLIDEDGNVIILGLKEYCELLLRAPTCLNSASKL